METAPNDGRHLLLCGWYVYPEYRKDQKPTIVVGSWAAEIGGGDWLTVSESPDFFYPTHWMPIPPPPETAT
ncbi:DUF551 domain-containing protein [Acidovorax sp. Root70]|uniref:DUF551 domain-containing protein n=1 Tax=Acidovorax sp. Root70 TaxID=1736590 RepID=UPI003511F2E2